jgi:hypothetical protein
VTPEPIAGRPGQGPDILCDDAELRTTRASGPAPRHAVSFGSLGNGRLKPWWEESRRSIEQYGPTRATYVIDKQWRWFNPGRDRILHHLRRRPRGAGRW